MKNNYKSIVFGAVFASSTVQAVSFDDEATWRASAGAFKQETFDNAETLSVNSISRGVQITELPSLDLKLNNTAYIYDGSSSTPIQSAPFFLINIYPYNRSFLPAISFSPKNENSLITAVGLYNSSGDDTLIIKFYDVSGNLLESTTVNPHSSIPVFGGLINSEGAAKVTVEGTGDANNWIAIDNLQVTMDNSISPIASDDCWAIYDNGSLHIPCIKVKTSFGDIKYEADMQYMPLTDPLKFEVTNVQKK